MQFDELIQVDAQKLCGDAKMASKVEMGSKVDHAELTVRILFLVSKYKQPGKIRAPILLASAKYQPLPKLADGIFSCFE